MSWLIFAFAGPVLWALSTHIDKYLVERYFKEGNVASLMIFTAAIGLLVLPVAWLFDPGVLAVDFIERPKRKRRAVQQRYPVA